MMRALCISVMLLIGRTCAQTEIAILPSKDLLYVTPGSNVTVVCVATGLNGKTVRWDHGGKQIANVAPATVVYSDPADQEKYLIGMAHSDGGNFSFTLVGYSTDDAGPITCGVAGVDPVNIRLASLVVPDEVFMTVDSPHHTKVLNDTHSSIVFNLRYQPSVSCVVTNSQPEAFIDWLWNSHGVGSFLNTTIVKQAVGNLHNVTSTIFLSPYFLYPPTIEENISEETVTENVTVVDLPGLEENFISDEAIEIEEVTRVVAEQLMPYGLLACKVTVGDRTYIKSRFIDLSDPGNSGSQMNHSLTHIVLGYAALVMNYKAIREWM